MKPLKTICLLILASFIFGCGVSSLSPIFTNESLIFKPELIGRWIENDPDKEHVFMSHDNKTYIYFETEKDGRINPPYQARITEIDGAMFVDLYPLNMVYPNQILTHEFFKLEFEEGSIILKSINDEWLQKAIDQKTVVVDHFQGELDNVILTGTTEEVREFLRTCMKIEGAFSDNSRLRRKA